MKGRRQFTKAELLSQMRKAKKWSNGALDAPFTAMSILCNYSLWKVERFGQNRLESYNKMVESYYTRGADMEQMQERLMQKAGFTVDYVEYSEQDLVFKNRYQKAIGKMYVNANNEVNKNSSHHLLAHFNTLIDLGFGKKRLERSKDSINELLQQIDKGQIKAEALHKELIDKVGIYIEMPYLV